MKDPRPKPKTTSSTFATLDIIDSLLGTEETNEDFVNELEKAVEDLIQEEEKTE